MVNTKLMTKKEIAWLNAHNKRCYELVGPLVDEKTRKWLERETKPIGKGWIEPPTWMKIFVTTAAVLLVTGLVATGQKK